MIQYVYWGERVGDLSRFRSGSAGPQSFWIRWRVHPVALYDTGYALLSPIRLKAGRSPCSPRTSKWDSFPET